ASDDTVDMVRNLLTAHGTGQSLVWCHLADLKKGTVNIDEYLAAHNPEVVIFDLSPPYDDNWAYFTKVSTGPAMKGRGLVVTTTNRNRLDEAVGHDSHALEVVGLEKDLQEIAAAIQAATLTAAAARGEASLPQTPPPAVRS
ncbi:MAG: hypothetical protein ABUS56_06065, partial [Acidobacteriota bacterium]